MTSVDPWTWNVRTLRHKIISSEFANRHYSVLNSKEVIYETVLDYANIVLFEMFDFSSYLKYF